jgi:hypothetical protein
MNGKRSRHCSQPFATKFAEDFQNLNCFSIVRTEIFLDHRIFLSKVLLVEFEPKKIYRLKEDQAFSLSLELARRERLTRHPSADFLLHSIGGGGDFVDTVIAMKILLKGMRDN